MRTRSPLARYAFVPSMMGTMAVVVSKALNDQGGSRNRRFSEPTKQIG